MQPKHNHLCQIALKLDVVVHSPIPKQLATTIRCNELLFRQAPVWELGPRQEVVQDLVRQEDPQLSFASWQCDLVRLRALHVDSPLAGPHDVPDNMSTVAAAAASLGKSPEQLAIRV
jgi:hypothetical protein